MEENKASDWSIKGVHPYLLLAVIAKKSDLYREWQHKDLRQMPSTSQALSPFSCLAGIKNKTNTQVSKTQYH